MRKAGGDAHQRCGACGGGGAVQRSEMDLLYPADLVVHNTLVDVGRTEVNLQLDALLTSANGTIQDLLVLLLL